MSRPVYAAVAVLLLGLLAVAGGGPLTTRAFRHIDARLQHGAGRQPSILAAAVLLRGGAWIGVLERLAAFATVTAGWPEGLAVVLAVKGLARYPELRATSSAVAERFIIGTFISVLWACGCAGLAVLVLRLLGVAG